MAVRKLQPIKESTADYERLEYRIKVALQRGIIAPLFAALGQKERRPTVRNAVDESDMAALTEALRTGQVSYARGYFKGRFSAKITRALKSAGAVWDAKSRGFRPLGAQHSPELRQAILAGESAFTTAMERVDAKLAQILPEEIAERIKVSDILDKLLWKTDRAIGSTLKGITIPADLTPERRKRIADEWQNNLQLYVKDFTEKETLALRSRIAERVFAGERFEGVVAELQRAFGVTQNKAKFLARQETSLLVNKYKAIRYTEAGVNEYEWKCVAGSVNHPVRPSHKALDGKVFRFDAPPITTAADQPVRRNNPGEDYNCRCFALPIVRF